MWSGSGSSFFLRVGSRSGFLLEVGFAYDLLINLRKSSITSIGLDPHLTITALSLEVLEKL